MRKNTPVNVYKIPSAALYLFLQIKKKFSFNRNKCVCANYVGEIWRRILLNIQN